MNRPGGDTKKSFPLFKLLFSFPDQIDIVLMTVGAIAALLNGLTIPLTTFFFGQLIDTFGGNEPNIVVHQVTKVSLKFVYLGIGSAFATFFQMSCWMVTGERQSERLRNMYLKAVLKQDITFFDTGNNMGEVLGKTSGDIVLIQDAMGEKVGKSLQLISTFIGGFVVAFSRGWLLVFVMLTTVPLLIFSGAAMSMVVNKMASREQEAYSKSASFVEQTIGSIKTVASFTGEREAINRYNKSLSSSFDSSVHEGLAAGFGIGVVMFIVFCSFGLAAWFGSLFIVKRGYTGGSVVNVIIAVVACSMSLGEASPCIKAFAAGKAAAVEIFETINRKPDIDSSDTSGLKLDDIRGDIELRDVYFAYPTRPDQKIFQGFSLSVPSGKTVALVGESGSGKSTVISLIERFYDPQAGEILIDDINLKEFQLRWIREKIGLVSQEPILFASSIKDNIAYGKDNPSIKEIEAAAEIANATIFIDKLPQGLETMVGDYGTQLSGGQKQRVAIARAILRNPRILLLDEATSALDGESEQTVQEALDRIMTNRTTIVVAHRLSTVRNSDLIAVIQQGKIVEKGSPTELAYQNGAYSQLLNLQEENNESQNERKTYHMKPECISSCYLSVPEASSVWCSSGSLTLATRVQAKKIEAAEISTTTASQQSYGVPLHHLVYLNRPELPMLILGCVFAAIHGSILPVFGVLLSDMIHTFYEKTDKLWTDSRFRMWMFISLGFVALVASTARSYFLAIAGSKLIRRIRSMSFEKVVHMEIGWFDSAQNSSSTIGAKLSMDVASIRGLVGDTLALIVQNSASVVLGVAIALEANWRLALVVVALLPLLGFNTLAYMKFTKGFSADAKIMYEEASQVANDAVRSMRTVASFSAEEKVMTLYRNRCKAPKQAGMKLGLVTGFIFGISFFLLLSSYAVTFYVASRLIQDRKATAVEIFRVFFALCMAAMAVSTASSITPDTSKAKASAASVFEILDRKSEIDSSSKAGTTVKNVNGDIRFLNVSFTYPMRPNVPIFCDLNLRVRSGEMVALVGESGCGKSTVISLLQRFYDPNSGQILLDGIDIKKFRLRWLRQQMGLVSQEPLLFNDTIRANIAYGKEGEATEAEIIAAAKAANAHQFISAMKQGYDTVVGERGVQLSGGQKQRVAIARAIVKEPKILLLDEATSALDAESERVVQNALDKVMVNKTTIVVAHRLSTIKGASFIAVMKNGVIIEQGKHESLVDIKDGSYASLAAHYISRS